MTDRGIGAITALVVCLLAVVVCLLGPGEARALDGGRYGDVHVADPKGDARGVVVLFSDHGGWTARDEAAMQAVAGKGALVVGVDSDAYLTHLATANEKCHELVGDAESMSHQLQRERHYPAYHTPILAGIGEGATLAELALAQAPDATIAGAVSVDPAVALAGRKPMCPGAPSSPADKGSFRYGAVAKLPGFWSVGLTPAAADSRRMIEDVRAAAMPVEVSELDGGHPPESALATLIEPHLKDSGAGTQGIASLPLVEMPAPQPSKLMAVVLSGDGGWRDLDKTIAGDLQQQNVSVIGWDSLRYFWSRKTPEQTAADVSEVLTTYMNRWHASRIALIGYSFGADVLPFVYKLLPDDVREHVVLMSLLGFAKDADFQISVRGWLQLPPGDKALPAEPAAARVPATLIQCFYGHDEDDTVCPNLQARGAEVIQTDGGHHFGGDYDALAARILDGFKRRAG